MADQRDIDISEPLLDPEAGGIISNEHDRYQAPSERSESEALGSQPGQPSWLSERQEPFRDSPAGAYAYGPADKPFEYSKRDRMVVSKSSRSMKRPAAAARARRVPWIVLDENGHRSFIHSDKRAIISTVGLNIPIRDMRLLDFNLGASDSTILVRDNAIIASMEHMRFIVTADKAIIPREGTEHNPLFARFVDLLEDAIVDWARQRREFQLQQEQEALAMATASSMAGGGHGFDASGGGGKAGTSIDIDDSSSVHHELQEPLPFELVVLEAALKEVLASLALQIKELEGVALPALDALTRSVSLANLERVRKVKTRHQRLTLRTEALRDELQRFLQDDDDMAEMCLTRKKELEEAARQALAEQEPNTPRSGGMQAHRSASGHFAPGSLSRRGGLALARFHSVGGANGSPPRGASALPSREVLLSMGGGNAAAAAAAAAAEEEADADAQQEVENLLESYYMQVDELYDKLVSIGEYIKDTEELLSIQLDSSRNRLIRFEIILSVATFSIMPFNLLAGILGENLIIPEQITGSVSQFYGVNIVATIFCVMVFYSITLYMRYTKVL